MSTWVPKKWGGEIVWASNDLYCGKILEVKKGHFSSFHRHKKVEDWLIYSGKILLLSSFLPLFAKDVETRGLEITYDYDKSVYLHGVKFNSDPFNWQDLLCRPLNKGDTIQICSFKWHLFYALEDSEIMEVSTPDEESERLTESY